ncbi:hypothetical protein [uncultured Methanomethylovorans sp.]|mgnify:CR=1 FL=1|uniref:phage tail protein n=1 Tax=uncultured Methanomethylovorans sp. TaxID=183759 RepID=UPI002639CF02|nr:hypothetical protein [uncultured Methanomethylovorans sp.]
MAEKAGMYAKKAEQKQTCQNSCKSPTGFNNSGSSAEMILRLQRTAGNQAVQRLIRSGVLQAELKIGQPRDKQEADRVAGQVMRIPESKMQSKCAECNEDQKNPEPPAIFQKAPARPEEDAAYQVVVDQLQVKAKHEKTPNKAPERKQFETKLAANLKPEQIAKQDAFGIHLDNMEKVTPTEFTVETFMGIFKETIDKLAKTLPGDKEKHDTVQAALEMGTGKAKAKQELSDQNRSLSDPLRAEVKKPASEYQQIKKEVKNYELKVDPAGAVPTIKHAEKAAPKPKTDTEISLDDKGRTLDNALLGHNVEGQRINIDEGSLVYPVSGESTFDEAGKTKREAQEKINKAKPRYREEEEMLIDKSQEDMRSLVNTGLRDYHQSRSNGFDTILGIQKSHASNVKEEKLTVFKKFQKIYDDTKDLVNKELEKLNDIEEIFTAIVSKAEKDFEGLVRNDLEYIYTPGFFDYSDWKDRHESEIKEEYERQKRSRSARENGHFFGSLVMDPAYIDALKIVRNRSAVKLFSDAKIIFVGEVNREVEKQIAKKVVEVLNEARKHIKKGEEDVKKAFDELGPKEKKEAENVLQAVQDQFQTLNESVEERQREIINDMARTYNQSVGKLQGTFDAIKKDVLTSWFEKAWNKLKAVVNAIIDLATRIAQLLGRIAYLAGDIISSPRYFFKNLVTGIRQGFSTFVDRIDVFLATAFFDWLRGSSGLLVQMPKDWEPKGIFSLFTQLLNLSAETVWQRMEIIYGKTIANAFRRGEVLLAKGLEIFGIVRNEGLGGLWDHIKESLGNILEETLGMIKETVLYAAIKKAIFEIGKMLVPGGGFIAIAEKVIRLLQFIVEARNKILDLIESFVDSMEMAVKGNITGIVKHITGALTKFITIALDFLVTFFGLGSLKEKVERFIERMRKPIIRGIDWVLGKARPFVMKGKELFEMGKAKIIGVGKAVMQVGVPEDPNERLRLAARASVSAAQKLTGRVTQALLNTILAGIKVRYGLKTIQPYEKSGTWWVRAAINPEIDQNLGVPSVDTYQGAVQVREAASRALEHELSGAPNIEEAHRIVGQVAERLRPKGLKGLEIGKESQEGVRTIYAEASEKRPLGHLIEEAMKHKEVPRSVSVRTAAELKLAPGSTTSSTQLIEATHTGRRPAGGIVLESKTGTELRIVTWNVTALTSKNASDHAEDQFAHKLRELNKKENIMARIEEIRLENFDLSPCDDCCGELRKLLNEIRNVQKGNLKLKTAEISWQKLYKRQEKIKGHHSATQTTWSGIRQLRGWTIHAPPEALPLEETGEIPEDIFKRYEYKKKETTAMIKPVTELTAQSPISVQKRRT